MGLSTVVGPVTDPVTLAEAKAHLRVTSDDEDGLIAAYILAAREFIESQTHLRLITQTLDYTIDDEWPCLRARGYYRTRIELPVRPVSEVTSISYVDRSGVTQTLDPSAYVLRSDGPVSFIEPSYGTTWPSVRCQTAAITVRFVAGTDLSGVPNPLMQAMRLLIGHQYEQREAVNVGSSVTSIDFAVEAFLSPYRFTRVT